MASLVSLHTFTTPSSSTLSPPTFTRLSFNSNSVVKFRKRIRTASFCVRSTAGDIETTEWLKKLPDKNKALYSHSLPCIEAWLMKLGFRRSKEDMAVWFVEKAEWHAQLSLDVTDLHIRYLKSGPGDLEKDVDRRFSYALSREDIENAILGGP